MVPCRCEVLNVMSGAVARDYARSHLDHMRTDAMGREVHRCPELGVEWFEERSASGYAENVHVLRRNVR